MVCRKWAMLIVHFHFKRSFVRRMLNAVVQMFEAVSRAELTLSQPAGES